MEGERKICTRLPPPNLEDVDDADWLILMVKIL
jgi:hypothetical protein